MARILIVDDDAESARMLAHLLEESGDDHETRAVTSARTALQTAVEFRPDLIFVDVELPDMSGYDVALFLHQHPQLQRMRLIALTDTGEHPGREHARSSGFERYLVKPISAAALQEVLGVPS